MMCIGGYLMLVNQVMVVGSYWSFFGETLSASRCCPCYLESACSFWRGRSIVGWVLTIAGALFIFAGIIANMHIFFRPTSLFDTIVILAMLVGGLGLIARGVQPHSKQPVE